MAHNMHFTIRDNYMHIYTGRFPDEIARPQFTFKNIIFIKFHKYAYTKIIYIFKYLKSLWNFKKIKLLTV